MNFVVIDLSHKLSSAQQSLVDRYYRNLIPHVVIVDASGKVIYNQPGEVEESKIADLLDGALRGVSRKP